MAMPIVGLHSAGKTGRVGYGEPAARLTPASGRHVPSPTSMRRDAASLRHSLGVEIKRERESEGSFYQRLPADPVMCG